MSHHVLHVLHHGALLSKERGFILCKDGSKILGRMPIEDLRAIVIAARGIHFSSAFLSSVLASDAIILHCDEKYQPCGVSAACARIVDPRAMHSQGNRSLKLHSLLWRNVLQAKISNQAALLRKLGSPSPYIEAQASLSRPSESNCSAKYWRILFDKIGRPGLSRRSSAESPVNHKLNHGYAVLAALIHRAIIAHGLNPLFGCHHMPRPKAHPLVCDLMEPLRPFLDSYLCAFEFANGGDMKQWAKLIASSLASASLKRKSCKVKMLDAIDTYISSYASSLAERSISHLWIPEL